MSNDFINFIYEPIFFFRSILEGATETFLLPLGRKSVFYPWFFQVSLRKLQKNEICIENFITNSFQKKYKPWVCSSCSITDLKKCQLIEIMALTHGLWNRQWVDTRNRYIHILFQSKLKYPSQSKNPFSPNNSIFF